MGYRKLHVYNESYKLSLEIHRLTMKFPRHELYEIGSQLRRAAISIPLNIAEGYGRRNHKLDYRKFIINAQGSSNEVVVLLQMIKDLGYIPEEEYLSLSNSYTRLGKQLNKFIDILQQEIRSLRPQRNTK
ncbi:four helix bundle protein [Desulforamulus ferrireducens]|uniref:Four helix bundle protein n=2 Tax=Desulforamulus ferrireducens TaxID=1833852 RepID=A0A1S6J036_9FIRM|nr:four helix bundle protein [Desulforamulus ferrireducens]